MSEQGEKPMSKIPEPREELGGLMALARAVPVLGYIAMEKMRPKVDLVTEASRQAFDNLPPQVKRTIPMMTFMASDHAAGTTLGQSLTTMEALYFLEALYAETDSRKDHQDSGGHFSFESVKDSLSEGFGHDGDKKARKEVREQEENLIYTMLSVSRPLAYFATSLVYNWDTRFAEFTHFWNNNSATIVATSASATAGALAIKAVKRKFSKR